LPLPTHIPQPSPPSWWLEEEEEEEEEKKKEESGRKEGLCLALKKRCGYW